MADDMSGAAQIASNSFNSAPMGTGTDMGPMAINMNPDNSQMSAKPTPTDPNVQKAELGAVNSIAGAFKSNSNMPNTSGAVAPVDSSYHALFSSPGPRPQMQMPQVQAAPMQMNQIPMAAPIQQVPMAQPMPPPQLAMSDINAKTSIRPVRADLDQFLNTVYQNVLARKKP